MSPRYAPKTSKENRLEAHATHSPEWRQYAREVEKDTPPHLPEPEEPPYEGQRPSVRRYNRFRGRGRRGRRY